MNPEGARRGSLYALLHSPSLQLSWAQVAFMVLGAAEGMRHLHAHAVLHRDLKSGDFTSSLPPCPAAPFLNTHHPQKLSWFFFLGRLH